MLEHHFPDLILLGADQVVGSDLRLATKVCDLSHLRYWYFWSPRPKEEYHYWCLGKCRSVGSGGPPWNIMEHLGIQDLGANSRSSSHQSRKTSSSVSQNQSLDANDAKSGSETEIPKDQTCRNMSGSETCGTEKKKTGFH